MRYFVLSELGINHLGNMQTAKEMIEASSNAGANAVKFQYYDWHDIKSEFEGRPDVLDIVKQSQLSLLQIRKLRDYARKVGQGFVCTPFKTFRKVAELARLRPDAIKIRFKDGPNGSPDGVGLVEKAIDSKLVNLVLSSVQTIPMHSMRLMWHPKVRWMYCLPLYPPEPEDFHPSMVTAHQGFSDHYPNITASLLAAALTPYPEFIIEKHVMFSPRPMYSPDGDPERENAPDKAVSIGFEQLEILVNHLRLYERLKPETKNWGFYGRNPPKGLVKQKTKPT